MKGRRVVQVSLDEEAWRMLFVYMAVHGVGTKSGVVKELLESHVATCLDCRAVLGSRSGFRL